ncbi:putative succinate-semialdehyde dehydrogenase (NAD(+)), protein kinase RLK-Pelle-RLCK-VIIa-2 family [Helianthus debilis subsp. tardiflorus]
MKLLEEFNDPNVVKILGYCMEEDSLLIVYEFMHQGTLNDYLFSVERRTERHLFNSRVKIAIGITRGLVFLRTQPQLVDCSLQMHNILLDEVFVYNLLIAHKQEIGQLLTLEQGKPLREAIVEVAYAARFIELFAEEAKSVYGDIIPSPLPNCRLLILKE